MESKVINKKIRGGVIPAISGIRLMAMCSIIACHFCQYYGSEWAWWLNVGVQVFFIISGFLYGNKDIGEPISWLKKQFTKILVPYYLFLCAAIACYAIVAPEYLSLGKMVGSLFTLSHIKGIEHLWFISYILFCYLLTPYLAALRDYLDGKSLYRSLLVIAFVTGVFVVVDIGTKCHFRPGNVCCYFFGYFTAVFMQRCGWSFIRRCVYFSLFPCILSNIVYCSLRYTKGMDMDGMYAHLTDFSHLFLAYTLTLILMVSLKYLKINMVLAFSDKNSYEIYLVHQLFILSPLTMLSLTESHWMNGVLCVIAILICGSLLGCVNKYIRYRLYYCNS